MTKISIRNFQSIKAVDFQIDGFTVIVGKNNIGKSAVIRAIESALTNAVGNQFIHLGEKHTEVRMSREGLDLHWKKGDSAVYTVNGQNFSKLNRTIPQPLIDAGYGKLEIGDLKFNLTVAPQFEEIFLLDEPGSVVTEVLASIYNLNTISTADDLCQKELKGQKTHLKTREGDLKELQGKLVAFQEFEDIKKEMEILAGLQRHCDAIRQEIELLKDYEQRLDEAQQRLKILEPVKKIAVPQTQEGEKEIVNFEWIKEREIKISASARSLKNLMQVVKIIPPDPHPCNDILIKVMELESLEDSLTLQKELTRSLSEVLRIDIPELDPGLTGEVVFLRSIEDAVANLMNFVAKLSAWPEIDIASLEKTNSKIESVIGQVSSVLCLEKPFMDSARATKNARDELRLVTAELETTGGSLKEFKACPACERPF